MLIVALTDRIPYQALVDRPRLKLPGGKKLAVWAIPQRRGMADRERDAANGAEPADGAAAVAGCAQLVLA